MGLQLIFVVEANKKSKTDRIYIKETIDRFYKYNVAHLKLSTVYMDGKNKYLSKEKEVKSLISEYNGASSNNVTKVIYCFDCDDYDSNPVDKEFLEKTQEFCKANNYEYVWFCKDIERVYLGKKVEDGHKNSEATRFKANKLIDGVSQSRLNGKSISPNMSNILSVLDECKPHLVRKEK